MNANTEQSEPDSVSSAAEPKTMDTARVAKRGANVAPKKGRSGKKVTAAKKAPKTRKREKKGDSARDGSKAAAILERLKRPDGATVKELMKVTTWRQPQFRKAFRLYIPIPTELRKSSSATCTQRRDSTSDPLLSFIARRRTSS